MWWIINVVIFGTNTFYCKTTSEEEGVQETNKKKFNYNLNDRDYKKFFGGSIQLRAKKRYEQIADCNIRVRLASR